jgi:hypothetical protein
MMELLFWSPKVLSNSAFTSSGTLKLTVAIIDLIVEIFNNETIRRPQAASMVFSGDLSTFQDFMPIPGFPIAESRARLDWAKPASTQDRFLD